MGLTMHERHAVGRELAPWSRKATKKERTRIIDEFVALTGNNRCYAAFMLRSCGRKQVRIQGRRLVFPPAQARPSGSKRSRSKSHGNPAFLDLLKRLWALSDLTKDTLHSPKRERAFVDDPAPNASERSWLQALRKTTY